MNAVAGLSLAALAPPARLTQADELPLGSLVRWTHRAAVARWTTTSSPGEWRLTEGCPKGWRPAMTPRTDIDVRDIEFGFVDDAFYRRSPGRYGVNKTVIVWPDEGTGRLFGLVRRGIGESYAASGGTGGLFDDSWEPGGFSAVGFVPLYAVKTELRGVDYLLCPHWAVSRFPPPVRSLIPPGTLA